MKPFFSLLLLFVLLPTLRAATPTPSPTVTTTAPVSADALPMEMDALTVATNYFNALKSESGMETVPEFWDADALLTASFGLMYLELSAAEKTSAQAAFFRFLASPFSSPRLRHFFSTIELGRTKTRKLSDTLMSVTVELVGEEGRLNAVNTLLLSRTGKTWRIVDQRQGTSLPIRPSLVLMWAQEKKGPTESIASVLNKAANGMQRQALRD